MPHDKLKSYFADRESVKEVLLNKVTFCNNRIKVWLRISHDLNVSLKPVQHTIILLIIVGMVGSMIFQLSDVKVVFDRLSRHL